MAGFTRISIVPKCYQRLGYFPPATAIPTSGTGNRVAERFLAEGPGGSAGGDEGP